MDNYEVAMETAEKCCQANAQFAEISEVSEAVRRAQGVQSPRLFLHNGCRLYVGGGSSQGSDGTLLPPPHLG